MKALIIGCGGQGAGADEPGNPNAHKVLSYAHAFEITGVDRLFYDVDLVRGHRAADVWHGEFFFRLRDALEQAPEIVVIATPDNTHCEVMEQVYRLYMGHDRGRELQCKLMICEKPIGVDYHEAAYHLMLLQGIGIPVLVDYTRRFIPTYQALRDVLKGEKAVGYCRYNRGLLHSASHAVDTFRFLGITDYDIEKSVMADNFRDWELTVRVPDAGFVFTESRVSNQQPVDPMFDKHMFHVVHNALSFLTNGTPLLCTGHDALETLNYTLLHDEYRGGKWIP